eukprot:6204142-Pleurochrysis_carterae.AAC.1
MLCAFDVPRHASRTNHAMHFWHILYFVIPRGCVLPARSPFRRARSRLLVAPAVASAVRAGSTCMHKRRNPNGRMTQSACIHDAIRMRKRRNMHARSAPSACTAEAWAGTRACFRGHARWYMCVRGHRRGCKSVRGCRRGRMDGRNLARARVHVCACASSSVSCAHVANFSTQPTRSSRFVEIGISAFADIALRQTSTEIQRDGLEIQ